MNQARVKSLKNICEVCALACVGSFCYFVVKYGSVNCEDKCIIMIFFFLLKGLFNFFAFFYHEINGINFVDFWSNHYVEEEAVWASFKLIM